MKFLNVVFDIGERVDSAEGVLRMAIDRTGYRRFAENLSTTEDVDRGENIDELLAFASEYDEREEGGIRGFMEEISLLTDCRPLGGECGTGFIDDRARGEGA